MLTDKVKIAKEDKETIYKSFLSLAENLKPTWYFWVSVPDLRKQPLSRETLKLFFEHQFERAKGNFLERERQEGKPWRSIAHYIESTPDPEQQLRRKNNLRLMAWSAVKGKLLEGLCLMATLSRVESVTRSMDINLFEQLGPIQVRDENQGCFIWTQQSVQSLRSGLNAKPDIAITTTAAGVTTSNILSLIECKCRGSLGAADIRGEFGKAYDLGSPSYTLVSYNSVQQSLIEAAKELGVDVQVFSLNTDERERFIRGELDVGKDMATRLSISRKRRMFLAAIENRAADVRRRGN